MEDVEVTWLLPLPLSLTGKSSALEASAAALNAARLFLATVGDGPGRAKGSSPLTEA
jgi:hypothetical protein